MTTKKVHLTFWVGDKKINDFMSGADLGVEGVFYKESISMSYKKPHVINGWEKKKLIDGITKIYEDGGKEVRDFVFTAEI